MVTVRAYEPLQEMPTVRQGRADNPLSERQASSVGRQLQGVGQDVARAGGAIGDMVEQETAKANKLRLNDAFNQASDAAHALRYDKAEGYNRLKGGDAVKGVEDKPLADWYGEKLSKRIAEIRQGLGNQVVAGDFDLAAADLVSKFKNDAITYEAEQSSVYAEQVRDATISSSTNSLAADPFSQSSGFYIDRARDALADKARTAGLSGEALDEVVKAGLSKVHGEVMGGMLDAQQVAAAKTYFDLHKGDMAEADAKRIEGKLQMASDAKAAQGAVSAVWAEYGPKSVNSPLNSSAMDAALREQYRDDPAGLKAAREELSQRKSAWEFQENETNANGVSTVWKALQSGQTIAQVEGSRAWLALPGDTQAQIRSGWRAQRSSEASNFEDTLPDSAWAYYNSLISNDTVLAKTSPAMIEAEVPNLGRKLVQQLLDQRERVLAAGAKAGLAPGKIDNDIFNTHAARFGLKPFSTNDRDQAKVARLRSRLELLMAQSQAEKGRPLSPTETDDLIRRELATGVMVDNTLKPLVALTPEEAAKVKVQGANRATVAKYMAEMYEQTQEPQYEPTEENIRRTYLSLFDSGQFFVDE